MLYVFVLFIEVASARNLILHCLSSLIYMYDNFIFSVINCGDPPVPLNGTVSLDTGTTTFASTSTYQCDTGFLPREAQISTCEATMLWSPTPTCLRKDYDNHCYPSITQKVNPLKSRPLKCALKIFCDVPKPLKRGFDQPVKGGPLHNNGQVFSRHPGMPSLIAKDRIDRIHNVKKNVFAVCIVYF